MVSNPTVQYVIYEWLVARLAEWRRSTAAAGVYISVASNQQLLPHLLILDRQGYRN